MQGDASMNKIFYKMARKIFVGRFRSRPLSPSFEWWVFRTPTASPAGRQYTSGTNYKILSLSFNIR